MQIDFINVVFTVFTLIALAIPGFLLFKAKMLNENSASTISNVVLYACQPMLVFMGFQGKSYSPDLGLNMLIVAGLSIVLHLLMTLILCIFVKNKSNEAKINCLRFASIFGNCGFIGMPMIQSLFSGESLGAYLGEATIYCAVMIAVFNILTWTLGVYLITKDKKQISIKKVVLNPTILAVIIGFIVFMIAKKPLVDLCVQGSTGDTIITKFVDVFALIGNAVTPMSMMVIGIRLANVKFKSLFVDKTGYINSFFKLIVASLVTILVVTFLPISSVIKYTLFFLFSMPSAASTVLYAVKYGSDADSASIMVLLSSVLSMITIPLMFLFYTGVFGSFI